MKKKNYRTNYRFSINFFIAFYYRMASMIKKVTSFLKSNMILIIALIVGVVGVGLYSNSKGSYMDSMTNNMAGHGSDSLAVDMENSEANVEPSTSLDLGPGGPLGTNQEFANIANGEDTTEGLSKADSQNPKDLLPRDTNSEWARLNPSGQGDLSDINLLKSGHHMGINTTSTSNRYASLQLRADPPISQVATGPWHQTTISKDPSDMRRPLE